MSDTISKGMLNFAKKFTKDCTVEIVAQMVPPGNPPVKDGCIEQFEL